MDTESGLVHTVIGTAVNVNNVTQAAGLLHGQEAHAWGDAGYQGASKRKEMQCKAAEWHVVVRPGKCRALDLDRTLHQ